MSPLSHRQLIIPCVCSILLSLTTQAVAQDDLLNKPPPTPLHAQRDVQEEHTHAPSSTTLPDDEAMNWPQIIPSVALMGHIGLIDEEFDWPGLGLWLGANYYPWPDRYNTFWSVGLKLERNQELRDRPHAVVPTVRSGFAALKGDPRLFKNQLFANVQIYALAGRHIPLQGMPNLWRLGAGVISPRLAPANAMMLLWGVPLPNQFEIAIDMAPDRSQTEVLLMLGVGL